MLPRAGAISVAAACIGGDERLASLGIATLSHLGPPPSQRGHGECGSAVVTPDVHPRFVASRVMDAVALRYDAGANDTDRARRILA